MLKIRTYLSASKSVFFLPICQALLDIAPLEHKNCPASELGIPAHLNHFLAGSKKNSLSSYLQIEPPETTFLMFSGPPSTLARRLKTSSGYGICPFYTAPCRDLARTRQKGGGGLVHQRATALLIYMN